MTIATKTTKLAPGMYRVSDGEYSVEVFRNQYWDGWAWIALAGWSKNTVTDPVPTKREAVGYAIEMLKTHREVLQKIEQKAKAS